MALTIVETLTVTGGVDTHADAHVAAALDHTGGLLGTETFPTTPAGYGRLLAWLRSFGPLGLVGVEGTRARVLEPSVSLFPSGGPDEKFYVRQAPGGSMTAIPSPPDR